ncbi:MAG: PspC domain-containing protein [Bacteroidales bacterium]|nr:PspC domain-containing protein [Bacteroidales bacterium]
MKRTVKANIGGFSYNLDEDAYEKLNGYIDELRARLGAGTEASEIISDIEERISELLAERLAGQSVVSLQMVEELLIQLGNPDEIGGDGRNSARVSSSKPLRRLYRDPENAIIGGVCSGLAEYFAVDPIVIRLVFILLFFAKGFGLLLYLVLWVATHKAVTPKQKLEMRGEPVTLSNIGSSIKEEMRAASVNIHSAKPQNFLQQLFAILGQIAYYSLKVLLVIIKVIAFTLGGVVLLSTVFAFLVIIGTLFFGEFLFRWVSPEFGHFSVSEFLTSIFDISSSLWVTIPVFLILIIPVVALIYAGVRILFRFKARDGLIGLVAALVWVAAVVTLAFTVFMQVKSLTIKESSVTTYSLESPLKSKTLIFKSYPVDDNTSQCDTCINYTFFDLSLTSVNGQSYISGKPEVIIEQSDDTEPSIVLIRRARGASKLLAKQNASQILYSCSVRDSLVVFDPVYALPNGTKWKNQDVSVVVNMPEGCRVYLDSSMADVLGSKQPFCNLWPDEMVGKTWVMTKNGLRVKH